VNLRPVLFLAFLLGCDTRQAGVLLPPDKKICTFNTLVLELPRGETLYRLNSSPLGREKLTHYLSSDFPMRPDSMRVVVIRADSTRTLDLAWILGAIGRAHGWAYAAFDPTCRLEIPSMSSPIHASS
jgi:hypothetical protein